MRMSKKSIPWIVLLTLPLGIVVCHGRDIPMPHRTISDLRPSESRAAALGISPAALGVQSRSHATITVKQHKHISHEVSLGPAGSSSIATV